MALGVPGLGCEEPLLHLLNILWPNIFETSPHVINAVTDAVDGLRVALGPTIILLYLFQVYPLQCSLPVFEIGLGPLASCSKGA
jgi:hypothetical protein